MIEPKKTPVEHEEPTSSLIERAVRAFDRGQFVPPSGPADLVPPSLTPGEFAPQPQAAPQAPPVQAYQPQPAPQAPAPAYAPQPAPGYAPQPQAYAPQPAPGYAPQPQAYAPQPVPGYAPQPQGYAPQPQGYAPQPAQPQALYHRVDRQRLYEEGLISPGAGASAQLEEFRIVKRQLIEQAEELRRRGGGGAAQRVMVTSPHAGDGKTYCAINLALSMAAEKDSEVLLVDLDIARNAALTTLGLPAGPGLLDAIANPQLDIRACVMPTDVPGLSVVPGGRPTSSDAEYLASARAAQVLDLLSEGAPNRIILFDTPPALAASIAAETAKLSGQVVLVVRADSTSASAVQDATSLLAGCPNIQLLLNAVQFSPSGRRFGSYHGYRG